MKTQFSHRFRPSRLLSYGKIVKDERRGTRGHTVPRYGIRQIYGKDEYKADVFSFFYGHRPDLLLSRVEQAKTESATLPL